jgi:hypothetical protein
MSLSSPPTSILDKVPDEILKEILDYTMTRDYPFFPEYCLDPSLRLETERWDAHYNSTPTALRAFTIHYPHSNTRTKILRPIDDSQAVHLADWLLVNTTNSRIRRLGKECFWSNKVIAMSSQYPSHLQQNASISTTAPNLASTDQGFALKYTQEVMFVDNFRMFGARFIALQKNVDAFPRLRKCTFIFGYTFAANKTSASVLKWTAQSGKQRFVRRQAMNGSAQLVVHVPVMTDTPPLLKELLVAAGMRENVQLEMLTVPKLPEETDVWGDVIHRLEMQVYPMLRFKASVLAKRREAAAAAAAAGEASGNGNQQSTEPIKSETCYNNNGRKRKERD